MKRRILAMLLALVMCLSTLPTAAFAVEGTAEESSAVTAEEATDAQEESADEAEEPAAAEEEATDAQEESTDEAEEPVAAEEDPAPAEEPEDDDSDDGSDIEVTRAEWLSALVKAFDMSVESGDSPDNYFSDLSSDSEYYDDIILAVEFGVVDVEAGGSIYPDAAATRDFAATTLNYCLGFQMDEDVSYDFTDSEDCSSPDDAQIAVDRGWFALIDGKFSPDTAITSAEMTVMLADAADVLAAAEIHENYDSSYQFADYVIQIYDDVEFNDDGTITIDSDSTGLSVGDTFVVYSETGPVLYTAESIITLASKTTVTTGEADVESALLSIDVEESVEADLSTFEAEADVETVYLATEAQAEEYSKNSGSSISYKAGTLVAQTTVTLDNGCKASVTVTIANMKLHKNIKSTKNFTVSFSGDITVDSTVSVDALAALGASSSITIGKIAWGPGSITISVDLSLNGKITATYTGNFEAGFGYSNGTFRLVKSFSKKSFSTTVEATASIGVKATAGVDLLVASGSIYATMGVSAKFTSNTYDDGETPENCVSISAWLYAKVGASAKILFKSYSKTKEIYTSSNSPYRISYHYEDGVKVSSCTRGSGSGYTTSDDSGLGSSSYGGGSSTGTGSGGSTYTIYTYSLDDDNNATITGYNGNVTALSIPETIDGYTVTAIGSSAFSGNTKLRVVVIPDTVTSIGNSAFKNCTSLTKVTLSSNLTTLSYYAFYGCTALTTITIPASLTSCPTYYGSCGPFNNSGLQVAVIEDGAETIPAYLFYAASNLVSVTIPDSVTAIGHDAFTNCTNLTGVILPANLTTLSYYAFYGCTALTTITIPASLTSCPTYYGSCGPFNNSGLQVAVIEDGAETIPAYLFYGASNLVSVTIPDSVTAIGHDAFTNCTNLTGVILPANLTTLSYYAFYGCTALTTITIPASLTSCPTYYGSCGPFNNSGLQVAVIEDGAETIPAYLFYAASNLVSVTIPDSVTAIGHDAFTNCTNLTGVILPANLTTLSYYAFYGCTALTTITIPASLTSCPTYYGSCGPFNNSGLQVAVIEDGAETIFAYLFYGASNLVSVTIPDSVTSIGVSAFQGCTSLTGVVLPDTLTSLGSYAFYGCKSLTEITIPSSLTSASQPFSSSGLQSAILEDGTKTILANLFYGASSLTAVTIPETVTSIGENAFRDCTSLVTFTISENITTIGGSAFRGCTALTGIVLPDSVSSIGTYVFSGCTSLTDVAWNNTVASIPSDTFNGCTGLVNFTLPSTVTAINSYAFNGCTALANITWSENLTTISEGAFYNCDALASLGLPDSVTTIGSKAFYDCDGLVTAIIPDSVTSIGGSAFYNCDALTTVDIGDSVASIGGSAFYNCDALTTVNISDSVTSLGTYVFYDCDALTDVTLGTGLTSIPADTFESCGALESIVIPYRVASIGNYAFKNCYSLTSVTIPRAVTSIGTEVFSYPSQMTIYGVTDTYAETYADENGITFVAIDISATKVTLSETALLLNKGATATLAMTVTPENFTDEVTWKSTDTSVATITDAGLVTAVAVGTATIKVTVGDVSATCKVTVVQPVTSISLNKTSLTLEALDTYQLTATVKPTDAYDTSVAWTSSDESVATVDENGLVTALGKGTATITVAAQDGSGVTKTCSVTVSNTAHIVSTVDELESDHNYANSCSDYWVYTLSGAETINVTFDERTEVEEDFDYLYIYDGNGSQIGQYTGTELAGQTVEITGDTVRIKLVSDSSGTAWGFKVVSVVDPNNVTTDISTCTVTLSYTAISYNGSAREPKVTVKDGTTTLTQGTDYTVAYSNNVNAGTATVTVTGMGSYTGTTEVSFTIRKITQTLTTEISSDTLAVGETAQITATAEGTVRYTSSDTGVATVSSAGLVTAVAAGTVTITVKAAATDNYYSATNTIEITVTDDSTAPTLDAPVISSVYSTVQTSAKVTWTQVDGADGYQIYRSTEKDGTYTCIKTISGGSTVKYTNSGLTVGQTYYYKVRAYVKDSSNNWVYSEFSDVRYMPAAVVFDNVYSNSTSRIRILWNEISGAEGYQIWRADSEDGEYKIVKTITSGDTTAYSNTGLESGKTYYYKMRAFTTADGSKVFGAYSDVFAVAVTPETPTLTVTSSSAGIAKLSWDEISGAAGYQLWRSDSEDGTYTLVKSITSGSTTSYSNSGLTSGNTYYYKVRAYTEVSGKKTFGAYSTVQSVDVK